MKDSEIIESNIDTARSIQKLRDVARKLVKSPEWGEVIEDAYFREEASRLVQAKMEPLTEPQLANVERMIYGVAALKQFMKDIMRRGMDIDNGIEEMEAEHQRALQEEINT